MPRHELPELPDYPGHYTFPNKVVFVSFNGDVYRNEGPFNTVRIGKASR